MYFLSAEDITEMQRDFAEEVAGPMGTPVSVTYVSGVSGGTWDETYQQWVGGTKSYTTLSAQRCLQYFVTERDRDLLEYGWVKAGDCIFSFLPTITDLRAKQELTITDPDGTKWLPVAGTTMAFYSYIETRVGSTQVAYSVLTRAKQ